MSATKSEIGLLALQALKVVDGDATPETNDTSVIEAAYDGVYARLATRHLVSWPLSGSVPDELIDPVVALVAKSRLTTFSPPQDVAANIRLDASTAFEDITEMLSLDYVPVSTPAVDY